MNKILILYIVGGLVIIGSLYGGFIYLPRQIKVAIMSESITPLSATTECPECPKCEPQIITKEIPTEKIIYKNNPEQEIKIRELETIIEETKRIANSSWATCVINMKELASTFQNIISQRTNDCNNRLNSMYTNFQDVIGKSAISVFYQQTCDSNSSFCIPFPNYQFPLKCYAEYQYSIPDLVSDVVIKCY